MTKKTISPEDRDLFRLTIGKVRTVKSDKVPLTAANKPKPYPKTQTINVEEHLNDAIEFDVEKVGLEDSLNFMAPGLQHSVLKKLRKGQFGLDAQIDLHGLNSTDAKRQLLQFLHDCVEDGCRCIHIVHGKGYRSADNHPVLKNHLNIWLRQHKDVQAFCSTPPKDGGTGAVFVLLQLSAKYGD
ncbi:MAG: Smr/MutS family protein [Methylobacter sp.]|nr:Smr/MutS family protein [Methylobacter sp.]MDP2099778.1 Smr/MutS family protein [Methylobacter sp.]MDP2428043.1 Smr/MutS family protein [Methylobacter sp.]MDP3055939.1 Smr/MutS family protein [Methylobacter sp.]MDP3363097.1 Smr/MutS family protein [Methylobacter sp.]